jgi:hypothetical protein
MADTSMDVDVPETGKKVAKGGKDEGKARFEVKKVCAPTRVFLSLALRDAISRQ